jgi:hypothetical protein
MTDHNIEIFLKAEIDPNCSVKPLAFKPTSTA